MAGKPSEKKLGSKSEEDDFALVVFVIFSSSGAAHGHVS
jgi:hypothetical protein